MLFMKIVSWITAPFICIASILYNNYNDEPYLTITITFLVIVQISEWTFIIALLGGKI